MLVNTKIFRKNALISPTAHSTMCYCNHVIFVGSGTEASLVNRTKHRDTSGPLEQLKEDRTVMNRNIRDKDHGLRES